MGRPKPHDAQDRRSRVVGLIDRGRRAVFGTAPDEFDPAYARGWLGRYTWLFGPDGYLPAQVSGWHNVPDSPIMLVSNHSGGSTVIDAWGLGWAWHRHFEFQRVLHVLGHEVLFGTRLSGRTFGRLGVLRASPSRAMTVLRDWRRDLLVMPGGDQDAWRPWTKRYTVNFAGRRGYAAVALRAGVPIVPVAHAGAHDSLIVLTDGHRLARRLRLHALLRIDVLPVHLSLPWGLGVGPWPHLPLPTRLRYVIGEPIMPPAALERNTKPASSLVREHDARVRHAMQGLLDRLARERRASGSP